MNTDTRILDKSSYMALLVGSFMFGWSTAGAIAAFAPFPMPLAVALPVMAFSFVALVFGFR